MPINRFASDINRKSKRFDSRYLWPETEDTNAFSFDWSNEANLLVSSTYLIPRNDTYSAFVKDVHLIENPAACIKLGNNKKSILGSSTYQGYFIAILIKQRLKKKSKIKLSSHYRCNQAGITEDIPTGK